MDKKKLEEFLHSCCRVCLAVESNMINSLDIIENFNKTIDEMLCDCADMKMLNDSEFECPTFICEECVTELVMVAKFREKCNMSEAALKGLITSSIKATKGHIKLDKIAVNKSGTLSIIEAVKQNDSSEMTDMKYENIEYVVPGTYEEENVEYMIIDNNDEPIEMLGINEIDVSDKVGKNSILLENVHNELETSQDSDISHDLEEHDGYVDETQHHCNDVVISQLKHIKSDLSSTKAVINHHCKFCGAGFAHLNNLVRHLQTHSDTEQIDMESFQCGSCSEMFSEEQDYLNHLKIHNTLQESKKELLEVETRNTTQIKNNTPAYKAIKRRKTVKKDHQCQHCNKAFSSQSLLSAHTRTHTGERPFLCETCSKAFKTRGALDLHVRRHSGYKPYQCAECNRGFVESSNLKVHMRTHTGEKPHQCTRCGRCFSRVFLLQIHLRTHTGERPYACDYDTCNKSFAQQSDLTAHKRIHSGERPHRCTICSKGFIKSSGLTQHMRRHNKFQHKNESILEISEIDDDATDKTEIIETVTEDNLHENEVIICYKSYNDGDETITEFFDNIK